MGPPKPKKGKSKENNVFGEEDVSRAAIAENDILLSNENDHHSPQEELKKSEEVLQPDEEWQIRSILEQTETMLKHCEEDQRKQQQRNIILDMELVNVQTQLEELNQHAAEAEIEQSHKFAAFLELFEQSKHIATKLLTKEKMDEINAEVEVKMNFGLIRIEVDETKEKYRVLHSKYDRLIEKQQEANNKINMARQLVLSKFETAEDALIKFESKRNLILGDKRIKVARMKEHLNRCIVHLAEKRSESKEITETTEATQQNIEKMTKESEAFEIDRQLYVSKQKQEAELRSRLEDLSAKTGQLRSKILELEETKEKQQLFHSKYERFIEKQQEANNKINVERQLLLSKFEAAENDLIMFENRRHFILGNKQIEVAKAKDQLNRCIVNLAEKQAETEQITKATEATRQNIEKITHGLESFGLDRQLYVAKQKQKVELRSRLSYLSAETEERRSKIMELEKKKEKQQLLHSKYERFIGKQHEANNKINGERQLLLSKFEATEDALIKLEKERNFLLGNKRLEVATVKEQLNVCMVNLAGKQANIEEIKEVTKAVQQKIEKVTKKSFEVENLNVAQQKEETNLRSRLTTLDIKTKEVRNSILELHDRKKHVKRKAELIEEQTRNVEEEMRKKEAETERIAALKRRILKTPARPAPLPSLSNTSSSGGTPITPAVGRFRQSRPMPTPVTPASRLLAQSKNPSSPAGTPVTPASGRKFFAAKTPGKPTKQVFGAAGLVASLKQQAIVNSASKSGKPRSYDNDVFGIFGSEFSD